MVVWVTVTLLAPFRSIASAAVAATIVPPSITSPLSADDSVIGAIVS